MENKLFWVSILIMVFGIVGGLIENSKALTFSFMFIGILVMIIDFLLWNHKGDL